MSLLHLLDLYVVSIEGNMVGTVFWSTCKVRWANANESLVEGSIDNALQEQFPEYTSRRLWHWRQKYTRERWEDVPDDVAARVSQLPNKFRRRLRLKLKGPGSQYEVPSEMQMALAGQFEKLVSGECSIMPRSDHVTSRDLKDSMTWLVSKLNKEVRFQTQEVEKNNADLLQSFSAGDIDAQGLSEKWRSTPKEMKAKTVRHLVHKFKKASQVTKQACNTSGNYLPFDDVQMQQCPSLLRYSLTMALASVFVNIGNSTTGVGVVCCLKFFR